jgi:hypothetical protein
MKVLVDKVSGKILTSGEAEDYGGPWGEGLVKGQLVLLVPPAGEEPDDLKYDSGSQSLIADPAKKAKRQAQLERRQRIKAAKVDTFTTIAELKSVLSDLVAEYRGD